MLRFAAALAAVLALTVSPALAGPSEDLAQIAKDYRAYTLAEDPLLAAREGDKEAAKRLPVVTPAAAARREALLKTLRARAAAVDEAALDDREKATRGLLLYEIDGELLGYAYDGARAPFTNDSGFHTALDYLARQTPIRTVEDADALLARYRDYPRFVDENIANMKRGLKTNWVQPALVVDRVIATMKAQQVSGDPRQHPFFEPFAQLPADFPERPRITDHAQKAIAVDIRGAQAEALDFIENRYRPKARVTLGALYLPGGKEWYAERVKRFTTLSITPDAVHELGLGEVARIRGEMEAIIKELAFKGSFAEFLEFLRTDEQFYAESEEDLLEKAALIAKRIDGKMPTLFGRLPRLSYGVIPVPAAMAPAYTTGRYWPGDAKRGTAGNYVVNTYDLKARPLYELASLTLHEGVPGHHHQIALADEIEGLPDFRRDVYVTAFGEGWGLYAEHLGYEMGIYRTPYERFGALSYEMWRACRLVADTGLHWKGWSREEAERCFLENSALSKGNITTEVDRYIAWPGQALAYKVGELKIKELRKKAEAELGARFDVRAFHDAVLEDGAVTLAMLEAKIGRWIAERKAAASAAPPAP